MENVSEEKKSIADDSSASQKMLFTVTVVVTTDEREWYVVFHFSCYLDEFAVGLNTSNASSFIWADNTPFTLPDVTVNKDSCYSFALEVWTERPCTRTILDLICEISPTTSSSGTMIIPIFIR